MKKLLSRRVLLIFGIVAIVLGIGGVVYGATVFTGQSTVQGTIQVNPYVPPTTPPPQVQYGITATNAIFNVTGTANAWHYITVNQNATITVTDTTTNGTLNGVESVSLSGSFPGELSLASLDTFPVAFTGETLELHFVLGGEIGEGTYNLADGAPIINLNCY